MHRLLSIATLAALLGGCASMRPASRPEPLRVLVYNIHAGMDADRVDNLARVASLVRETRADLVLLQEVDSGTTRSRRTDQLSALRSVTGMHAAFGSTLEFQGGRFGLGVLSRFPITSHRVVMLSPDTDSTTGKAREPRGALHVVVARPSGDLHVIDTHLDAFGDESWRRLEATRVAALADSLRATGATLLVGGDLNSTPESVAQAIVRSAGLRDAWTECGKGPGFTFPAAQPVRRIDYLFLPATMQCTKAEVLASQASDHRAVMVVVE